MPVLNCSKLFLQELQLVTKLEWDTELNSERKSKWRTIVKMYSDYECCEIPRCVGPSNSEYILYVLCNASKDFVGCEFYLKDGKTSNVSFISAQNKLLDKVSRSLTMAVLELLAVEMAVTSSLEFYRTLTTALLPINIKDIKLFSDSTIALSWISKSENLGTKTQKRSVFVNSRISNIVTACNKISKISFAHIGTSENTADLTTRIVSPNVLHKSTFISGPQILRDDTSEIDWISVPSGEFKSECSDSLVAATVNVQEKIHCSPIEMSKYSYLTKAVRTLQGVNLFINKLVYSVRLKNPNFLSKFVAFSVKYKDCENILLRQDQAKFFPVTLLF